jgi:hypothetical protein
MVQMSDISKSGGIINVYEAAKVALSLEQGDKTEEKKAPRSTMKNKKG